MAPRRRPILLLAPRIAFYAYVLEQLGAGFKALGYPCDCLNIQLEQDKVAAWARRTRACAVLEINRVLSPDIDWPTGVAHVAWIQDFRAYGRLVTKDLGVSDRLYFIVQPSVFGVTIPPDRAWSVLNPGVRTDVPVPTAAAAARDFCFAGYIPFPPDMQTPVSEMPDGRVVTLEEFLAHFPAAALQQSQTSLEMSDTAIDETCARIGCAPITKDEIRALLDEDLVRIEERRKVLEAILTVSKSLDILGAPTWQYWPQFKPYYRGLFLDPRELDHRYQTTRINLHNGILTMHFRVLDCLAAGAFVMVNETDLDFMPGGIRMHFEPDKHYGTYRMDDAAEAAKRYLADEPARQRIAAEGRHEVLASHTWAHRALQILRDLDLPVETADRRISVPAS